MPRHQTKRISFVSVDGPALGSRLGARLDIKIGAKLKVILSHHASDTKEYPFTFSEYSPVYIQGYSRGCARLKIILSHHTP